jgi:hypothetical protein
MDYANEEQYIEAMKGITDETHPPFMNFMGPGTRVEDRLSLNYDGKKGTKNYFIPTTYSDLVSFEHDLVYWSPDNIVKSYADANFIKEIRSLIGYGGIVAQLVKRRGLEGFFSYVTLTQTLSNIKKIIADSLAVKDGIKKGIQLKETNKRISEIDNMIQRMIESDYPDTPFIQLPAEQQRQLLEGQLRQQDHIADYEKMKERLSSTLLFSLLPKLIFTGYFLAPKIVKSAKKVLDNVISTFVVNPEYKEIQERVDRVKEKYEKYLNEVGGFEDAPWYRSLMKRLDQPEGEKIFRVKDNINKERAEELYEEFYNEFVDYQKYMNKKYEGVNGYQPFEIKELNKDNIDKVYELENVPSSFVEDVYSKLIKEEDKKDDFTNEEQEKIIELNEEIEKVLKQEQDLPFETPATDLEQYKKEKEEKEKEEKDAFDFEVDIPEIVEEDDKFDFEVDVPDINEEQEDDFNFNVDIPE